MRVISGTELARAASISYRQLDYWVRCDVLKPIDRPERAGSGTPRPFDEDEVRVARVLGRLRELGAPLDVLREVAGQLREFDDENWPVVLYVDTNGVVGRVPCALCWSIDLSLVDA